MHDRLRVRLFRHRVQTILLTMNDYSPRLIETSALVFHFCVAIIVLGQASVK